MGKPTGSTDGHTWAPTCAIAQPGWLQAQVFKILFWIFWYKLNCCLFEERSSCTVTTQCWDGPDRNSKFNWEKLSGRDEFFESSAFICCCCQSGDSPAKLWVERFYRMQPEGWAVQKGQRSVCPLLFPENPCSPSGFTSVSAVDPRENDD